MLLRCTELLNFSYCITKPKSNKLFRRLNHYNCHDIWNLAKIKFMNKKFPYSSVLLTLPFQREKSQNMKKESKVSCSPSDVHDMIEFQGDNINTNCILFRDSNPDIRQHNIFLFKGATITAAFFTHNTKVNRTERAAFKG